jgi:protein-S-isoprenylcysteine O-methyltransferase Ste14
MRARKTQVTCVFAARGGGISSRMRAIAACSIGYGIVLFLTVGLSLHYGDACVETASERDCSLSASWQATFHVAMAAASLASFVVLVRVSIRPSRQLQLAPHHSDAPLRSRVAGAAGVCICSVAWWALFNAWGCMVAFGSLPTSPAETERCALESIPFATYYAPPHVIIFRLQYAHETTLFAPTPTFPFYPETLPVKYPCFLSHPLLSPCSTLCAKGSEFLSHPSLVLKNICAPWALPRAGMPL